VDYLHCPLEKAVHDYKDCTQEHHRQRLEAVVTEGGTNCWYANPDEVVDYRYIRRHTRITPVVNQKGHLKVHLDNLPAPVRCRELTFELKTPLTPQAVTVQVDGSPVSTIPGPPGILYFTIPVHDNMDINIASSYKRSLP